MKRVEVVSFMLTPTTTVVVRIMKKRRPKNALENKDKMFINCILESLKLLYGLAKKIFYYSGDNDFVAGNIFCINDLCNKIVN